MRKLLSLCLLSSLLAAAVSAQAPALPSSLPARTNVVAYDDENAIPKDGAADRQRQMQRERQQSEQQAREILGSNEHYEP